MMTPDCLRQLYNFTDYEPQAPTNNTLAIGEHRCSTVATRLNPAL